MSDHDLFEPAAVDPPGVDASLVRPGAVHPLLPGASLDHVGVAVPRLDAGAAPFLLLGLAPAGADEPVAGQKVIVRTLRAGDVLLELLAPTHDDSPVARFLARRGPGLHHLAFRVNDLDAEIARLQRDGAEFVDTTPRPGVHGTRVAFLHPRFGGGVLVELVEHPRG